MCSRIDSDKLRHVAHLTWGMSRSIIPVYSIPLFFKKYIYGLNARKDKNTDIPFFADDDNPGCKFYHKHDKARGRNKNKQRIGKAPAPGALM